MPRPQTRPAPQDRVKITAEIPLQLYAAMQALMERAGVVRNRFIADALEARVRKFGPDLLPEAEVGGSSHAV